jgi:hypothetical protein
MDRKEKEYYNRKYKEYQRLIKDISISLAKLNERKGKEK